MNGMNAMFLADPVGFLQGACVDNKAMQEGLAGANHLQQLNAAKVGLFDLVIVGGLENKMRLTYAGPGSGHVIQHDVAIDVYWCPFLAGGGLPGWVDVPRFNPPKRMLLTAAMQGCAFAITNSPASAQHFRVFHNQHPDQPATWTAMQQAGVTSMISTFGYDQYGNPIPGAGGGMTNAFNLLWRPAGKSWSYVSQSNLFVPLPMGTSIKRDLAKPILSVPAGI